MKDSDASKLKLALGAASLFFFLVGLKRSYRIADGRVISNDAVSEAPPQREGRSSLVA